MKTVLLVILYTFSINSYSSTVAVLDNGVDFTHQALLSHIYTSSAELENGQDDDENGYIDDILGWNFITMSNSTFDFKREIYLTADIERYYYLRAKKTLNSITEAESKEYDLLRKNEDLKERRKKFVSWMHGTHVAGIAVNTKELPVEVSPSDLDVLSITYLGSATSGPAKSPDFKAISSRNTLKRQEHLNRYWKSYLNWQLNKFHLGVKYAASKAQVVNGSFGQSFEGIQKRIENYYEDQFSKSMSKEASFLKAASFMQELINGSTKILDQYPNTLFVFSAGNKKNNSDSLIHFPSAIRLPNSLSVGASFDFQEMAYFSNYGKKTVDLFAPGMAIKSTIPRQGYLLTNGTSQASPYVANIAIKGLAQAKKLGLKLEISQLKTIILSTVIKKDELGSKSVSGGIIFPERVFQAIRNLEDHSLTKSIKYAINQFPTKQAKPKNLSGQGLFLELPDN